MEGVSLGKILDNACIKYPDKIAIIHEDARLTYNQINRNVHAIANLLVRLGIKKGDNVAILLPNIPEFVFSYFAIVKVGAVAVTLNVSSTAYELKYFLTNSDSKALVTLPSLAKKYEEIQTNLPLCKHLIVTENINDSFPSLSDAIAREPHAFDMPDIESDDPAVMIYTSGLTGHQKGAVLTHRNLYTQASLLEEVANCTSSDRGLSIIPLFHSFGATVNMLGIIWLGASIVMMEQFSIDSLLRIVDHENVSFIAAVPRVFLGILLHDDLLAYNVDSLRFCITGGSKMPPEYFPVFEEKLGAQLMEGYGLTEGSPVCSFSRFGVKQKPGSIGIPVTNVEANICDENGNILPPGEEGELIVRGPNIMKGYYKDKAATDAVIKNGWLYTGDIAVIDEEGYIYLRSRKKRMIITNGFNVYPQEVEAILTLHPSVEKAYVIGEESLLRGEIVKAFIVKKATEEVDRKEIIRHCREYLSAYKVPRSVEFVETINRCD